MTLRLGVPVGPTAAAVAYLGAELEQLGNPLPVGVTPPTGNPTSYALLSRSGQHQRNPFVVDYMLRVRCFDADAEQCERNADLLWALMRAVGHRKITTSQGAVWISSATPGDSGPALLDDLDVPLFGLQFGMFWTIALKPT